VLSFLCQPDEIIVILNDNETAVPSCTEIVVIAPSGVFAGDCGHVEPVRAQGADVRSIDVFVGKKGSRQISPFYFVRCLRAFPQLLGQLHTAAPLSFNLTDIIVVVRERFVDLGDARLQLVRHCRRLLAAIEDEFSGLEDVIRRPSRRGFPHITSSAATTDTFRASACFGIYSPFGRLYSHELSHSVKQTGGLAHPFLVGMSGRDSLEPLQQC
jgi:hypothetical protein